MENIDCPPLARRSRQQQMFSDDLRVRTVRRQQGHYRLTVGAGELTDVERNAAAGGNATNVDDIEL